MFLTVLKHYLSAYKLHNLFAKLKANKPSTYDMYRFPQLFQSIKDHL